MQARGLRHVPCPAMEASMVERKAQKQAESKSKAGSKSGMQAAGSSGRTSKQA